MNNNNIEQLQQNPLFENLSQNWMLIAQSYLSPWVYFFFVLSVILLLFFWLTNKPPFNEPLVKRVTLLIVSILWFLLFFWQYKYIWYVLVGLIWLWLFKIKDELKQFFLINSYKKKELKMSLSQDSQETDVFVVWWKSNLYWNLSFFQFFGDIKDMTDKIKLFVEKRLNIFSIYLVYINLLMFILLIILWILSYDLFSTQYILKTD